MPAELPKKLGDSVEKGEVVAVIESRERGGSQERRVSADLLNQNAEMLQNTWRFGMEAVTEAMNRSTDHLGRTFGWTGDEAQQATERSVRNTQSVMESATTQ